MSAGHDTSMRRFSSTLPRGRGVVIGPLHPAYHGARSIFASRIFDVAEVRRVFKTGHQSRKIGKTVAKGPRRGWPIFTLTLEERATCPRSCTAWGFCYGNNMQAAERLVAGDELETAIWRELSALQIAHPLGFLVRLHILGDFYSTDYVRLWASALDTFPALHIFGFTARLPGTAIGDALAPLIADRWDRFAIRFSGGEFPEKSAEIRVQNTDSQALQCPAQTGATDCCATCALCWHSTRNIGFAKH